MLNRDIFILANGGFLAATGHSLPDEQFYKWCKFRGMVNRAYQDLVAQRFVISQECGVPIDSKEIPEDKEERVLSTFARLLDEEASVNLTDKIPIEYYKGVYDENRTDGRDIFSDIAVESVVLENLFCE